MSHHYLDERGKNKNGRNNTKRAKKSYFHSGLQADCSSCNKRKLLLSNNAIF